MTINRLATKPLRDQSTSRQSFAKRRKGVVT
jgi:hypothetical protein